MPATATAWTGHKEPPEFRPRSDPRRDSVTGPEMVVARECLHACSCLTKPMYEGVA